MKHHLTLTTGAAAFILTVASAHADSSGYTGFYAPDTWTITGAGIGGSAATFAPDGSELELIGSDGGIGATIKVTHTVLDDGLWSFDWAWYTPWVGSPGFDAAYYTINGTLFLVSDLKGEVVTGTVSVSVAAGDTIGWQVVSVDGIFGPGILTITDFRAPVPAPAALVLLGLAALPRPQRRRC